MARPVSKRRQSTELHPMTTADVEVTDSELLLGLTGPEGRHLKIIEREFGIGAGLRGSTVRLHGKSAEVSLAERVLTELLDVLDRGRAITDVDVVRSIRTLREHPDV